MMPTLEEINASLKKVNIKGKKYTQVDQRILGFRKLYPNGRILTEKLADSGARCDFKAYVYDGDVLLATGHSFEFQNAGMVNKTSYVENAETSAVGRALGMLGIGIVDGLASADEVQAAIDHQQRKEEPHTPLEQAQARLVQAEKLYCERHGLPDWGEYHRGTVMKRSDYKNEPEALDAIADELGNA